MSNMGRHLPLNELFPDDNATIEWLKSQIKTTKSVYKSLWLWFLEFTQMNGNQILEDRQHDMLHMRRVLSDNVNMIMCHNIIS